MTDESKKDLFFVLYILSALILAVIYFTMPERKEFIEFQYKWWGEFREAVASFFK